MKHTNIQTRSVQELIRLHTELSGAHHKKLGEKIKLSENNILKKIHFFYIKNISSLHNIVIF